MGEGGEDIGGYVRNFQDSARYREAERRITGSEDPTTLIQTAPLGVATI